MKKGTKSSTKKQTKTTTPRKMKQTKVEIIEADNNKTSGNRILLALFLLTLICLITALVITLNNVFRIF